MKSPQKPDEIHPSFVEAFNAGDIESVLNLYEPAATFVNADGSTVHGRDAIREVLLQFLALKPRIQIKTLAVHEGGGDLAALKGRWTIDGTEPGGGALQLRGTTREVVRRQANGSWCYVIDDPGMEQ